MEPSDRPSLERLLAEKRFLEALARRLVDDPEAAEDAVQETWLAALSHPPRHGKNPRAWLRAVLRTHVGRRFRRRRLEREVALDADDPDQARGADPSAEALAARREILARAAAAVDALAEPYRTVLVLRFFEEREPEEIARVLGRPRNTVQSQLRRGLALVRERLDRDAGGDRSRWAVPLVAGAAAPGGGRPPVAPPRAGAGAPGGLTRIAAIARVVETGGAAWLLLRPDASAPLQLVASPLAAVGSGAREVPTIEAARAEQERLAVEDPAALDSATTADGAPSEPVEADPPPAAPAPRELVVLVRDEDGAALGGVEVLLQAPGGPDLRLRTLGLTDPGGRIATRFTAADGVALPTREDGRRFLGVAARKHGFVGGQLFLLPLSDEGDARLELVLESGGTVLLGTVRDTAGRPLPGASVRAGEVASSRLAELPSGVLVFSPPNLAATDANGRYELPPLRAERVLLRAQAPGHAPSVAWIALEGRAAVFHDPIIGGGSSLAGAVRGPDGAAVPDAIVRVARGDPRVRLSSTEARTDASGAYRVEGCLSGPTWAFAEGPGGLWAAERLRLPEQGELRWSPELSGGPGLALRVQREDGRPLAGCLVELISLDADDADGSTLWRGRFEADAQGRVRARPCPRSVMNVRIFASPSAAHHGLAAHAVRALAPGGDERVVRVPAEALDGGVLVGSFLDAGGEPFSDGSLWVRREGSILVTRFPLSREGAFRVDPAPPGSHELVLDAGPLGSLFLGAVPVAPGTTVDLGALPLPPTGMLAIEWSWPEGTDHRLAAIEGFVAGPHEREIVSGPGPPPASLALLPGVYAVSAHRDGRELARRTVGVEAGAIVRIASAP